MNITKLLGKLVVFVVAFLLVMLPVSTASQLSNATADESNGEVFVPQKLPPVEQPAQQAYYVPDGDSEAQLFCFPTFKECKGSCWGPCFFSTFYCGSKGRVCCSSSAKFCADNCWTDCPAGQTWKCGSAGAFCVSNCNDNDGDGYGSGCSKGSDCNDNDANVNPGKSEACGDGKDNDCDGQTDEGCCAGNRQCNGACWTACPSGQSWHCVSTGGMCCTADSQWCGGFCWTACPSGQAWSCGSDGKGHCTASCTDKDSDGYGSGCSKGSDCNDNDAGVYKNNVCGVCAKEVSNSGNYGKSCTVCNGNCCATSAYNCNSAGTGFECPVTPKSPTTETCNNVDDDCDGLVDENVKNACGGCGSVPSETCGDGKDNNCNGQIDENCCPSSKPYFWDGQCRECPQDKQKKCGSTCYGGNECGGNVPVCDKNNKVVCCHKDWPYYCSRTDGCWKSSAQCNSAQKCGSEPYSNCLDQKYPNWNCRSDGKSVCCQAGTPYWWESDKQCHKSSEPVKCSVPDGSSALCDCNTDADCAKVSSSKPYCGETYGKRESSGFHACLSSQPEYCGNGKCASGEDYKSCAADCPAPKGTIKVDVVYSSGNSKGKPISGAYVFLDNVQKGTTDNNGKASFEASYGSRTVKVECPNNDFCDSSTVSVSGTAYKSFKCPCNPPGDSDGDGFNDEEEQLLGTDQFDPAENTATVVGSYKYQQGCIDTRASASVQALHETVVQAFNATGVLSQSFTEKPKLLMQTLANANLLDNVMTEQQPATLRAAINASEKISMLSTKSEFLIIITDEDTGVTSIFKLSPSCEGTFAGIGVGVVQSTGAVVTGFVDLIVLVGKGTFFVLTLPIQAALKGIPNVDFNKVAIEGEKFIKSVPDTVSGVPSAIDKLKHQAWIDALRKGSESNPHKGDKKAYIEYQLGFVNGYIGAFAIIQILSFIIPVEAAIGLFAKGAQIAKGVGIAKIVTMGARVSEKYGQEVGLVISKLKIAEKVESWALEKQDAFAALIKLAKDKKVKDVEKWLDDAGEAGAGHATDAFSMLKKTGKFSDDQIAELMNSKLGRQTLASVGSTDDLILKQAKLVHKWGVKTADDVVSKGGRVAERTEDLNKVLNAMPENLVDDFDSGRAVKFLGNKDVIKGTEELAKSFDKATIAKFAGSADDFEAISKAAGKVKNKFGSLDDLYPALKSCLGVSGVTTTVCSPADIEKAMADLKGLGKFSDNVISWTLDGIKAGVIDINKVTPEKLAQYIKGVGSNPFAGTEGLVKMFDAPGKQVVAGSEKINDILILKNGNSGFGLNHILEKHKGDFLRHFGDYDAPSIKKIIEDVTENGVPGISNEPGIKAVIEKKVSYNGRERLVRVVYNIKDNVGSITTAFPVD